MSNYTDKILLAQCLIEAADLLSEEIFYNEKTIYNVRTYKKPDTNNIFGLLNRKEAVLDILNSYFDKNDDGKYILDKKSSEYKYYLYEYKVKKYKTGKQNDGKVNRNLYYIAKNSDIISGKIVGIFDSMRDLAKFVNKEIIEID